MVELPLHSPPAEQSSLPSQPYSTGETDRPSLPCRLAVSFGITGKDYVLLASDTSAARSIVKMKGDEDKQKEVGKHLVIACKSLNPRTRLD